MAGCLGVALLAGGVGGLLDPEIARTAFSGDGELAPFTISWLERYRVAALGVAAAALGATALALVRRRALAQRLARHPLCLPRAAALCVSLVVGLGLAEIGLRLSGALDAVQSTNTAAYADYTRAFWQRVRGQLNAQGYRDEPWPPRDAGDDYRILVIGDSFVFGFGVAEREDCFPAALAAALARRPGLVRCRVFNAGRPGADTVEQVRMLTELQPLLQPDLVVLGYYVNDAESEAEKQAFFGQRRLLPLVSDNLERVSHVWRLLEGRVLATLESLGGRRTYVDQLRAQTAPGSEAWEEHRGQLERFFEQAGEPAALVLFPLISDLENYPLEAMHRAVEGVASEAGVPSLDLRTVLVGTSVEDLKVTAFDPHLDARALERTAEATAAFLEDQGLVPHDP